MSDYVQSPQEPPGQDLEDDDIPPPDYNDTEYDDDYEGHSF